MISLPPEKDKILIERLHREGVAAARIIGEVAEEPEGRVIVRS